MKYSFNWLKELSGTKKTAQEVVDILNMHSFEVEGIEEVGKNLRNVIAGKIIDIKKHPNADRLQITLIDINPSLLTSLPKGERESKKYIKIVCGAQNIKVGDIVPVALPETTLPSGMKIVETEIRGVKSSGMLCAEDELGLGKDHSGILILNSKTKIGTPISKVYNLDDALIELDILANRGHDALSYVGIAREICALEGRKFSFKYAKIKPQKKFTLLNPPKAEFRSAKLFNRARLEIKISDRKLCPRYMGAVLENVEIKESPQWVKTLLINSGMKPINYIVDATNYVMLELGQPLHAFDADKLTNKERIKNELARIVVRSAQDGEKIKLLDESVHKLQSGDIVITDGQKPIALAGIMGGYDSAITQNTKNVIIESANFNPQNIRKTRMRLGIKTDASDRFEKEIDPNLAELALARVIEIIEWGKVGKYTGSLDIYPSKIKSWKIKLNLDYAAKLLGEKIPVKQIVKILESLEIRTKIKSKNLECLIPTFRLDLKTQEDLIEEIGRIYGYEKIKSQAPLVLVQAAPINEQRQFERKVKNILVGNGFSEVYNYSFYSHKSAQLAGLGNIKHLELENPMNPDQEWLRVGLIPNLFKNVSENLKRFKDLKIFEVGNVFWPTNAGKLPEEKNILTGMLVLEKDEKALSFYEMKSYVDSLFCSLGITNYYFEEMECQPSDALLTTFHKTRCAEIKIEGKDNLIGYVGEINPLILVNLGIHKRVAMFEFEMDMLQKFSVPEKNYRPLRKYPTVTRDISLIADNNVKVEEIINVIKNSGGNLFLDVDLFDIYQMDKANKTSYAFHIIFGADRTLNNKEVDELMKVIAESLEKALGVEVRK